MTLMWVSLLAIAVFTHPGASFAAPTGSTVIHLTSAQEKTLHIQTAKLKTALIRPRMTLYGELHRNPDGVWTLASPLGGVVLNMPGKTWPQIGTTVIRGTSLVGIKPVVSTTLEITLALELTKVKADLLAARVAQSTSAAAYRREKSLYAHNKAVSLQRVQAAQAAFAGARARVQADVQSIAAISQQLKTKAGGFLPLPIFQSGMITAILAHPGEAVAADQPLLTTEDFHTLLAAVALPAVDSGHVAMGTVIQVRALGHKRWLKARPLMLGPQVDKQTRGLSVLYVINNHGTLRPGMALTALVPETARSVRMTIIPRSAVVWWRGERWIYLKRGSGVFIMRELRKAKVVPNGYAVANGDFTAGRIVTKGAQLLMTIELSSTIKKAG
jgi:biotin carboxyl carrier protein